MAISVIPDLATPRCSAQSRRDSTRCGQSMSVKSGEGNVLRLETCDTATCAQTPVLVPRLSVIMRRAILLPLLSLAVMAAIQNEEQEKFDGKCPEIKPVENDNEMILLGRWYEWKKYGATTICNKVRFIKKRLGDPLRFRRQYRRILWVLNKPTILENEVRGRLEPVTPDIGQPVLVQYQIIYDDDDDSPETDYNVIAYEKDKFCVSWSCTNVKPSDAGGHWTNVQTLVIMTREKIPGSEVGQSATDAVVGFQLDITRLKKINQTNCRKA